METASGIEQYEIIEKIFIRDRWHVKINSGFNGKRTISHAHYIWLLGNPAFEGIPKGYVIHHLDHDEMNDDISNLVLMQKHHHVAHHWKQKVIKPKISIDLETINRLNFYPLNEPTIYQRKDQKSRFVVYFKENVNGVKRKMRIGRYDGQTFTARHMAERFKKMIWHGNVNEPTLIAKYTKEI